jgi:outer membrane protein assembly factor BamB
VSLLLLLLATLGGDPPPVPFGWRGDGSGRYPDATPPLEWSPKKNVRWKTAVGGSYASPILTAQHVILASEPNLLLCLERSTGKIVWQLETKPSDLPDPGPAESYKAKDTGLTAATPVTDGTTVYAVFANGIVRAVGMDGKPKWIAHIDAPQNTSYGRSASPILVGGKLIVHLTHLVAFDAATGKRLWTNEEARCTYGTPAPYRDTIVTSGGDVVRLEDGKGLNTGVGPAFHTTPVVRDGLVHFGDKETRAVKLDAAFKDAEVWSGTMPDDVFGSPLLHDGLLFTVTGRGQLYCFDSKGAAVIEGRWIFGEGARGDTVYSSIALAGKHLFIESNVGELVVLEATREAKQVAVNKLKEGSGSTPVFSGSELYLRDGDSLYCISR